MAQRAADLVAIETEIDRVRLLGLDELRKRWRVTFGAESPPALTKDLLVRMIAHRTQEQASGGLDRATVRLLDELARGYDPDVIPRCRLKTGTVLVREYQGQRHTVTIVPDGFVWRETEYKSLSMIARAITGTAWNGPRFFGLRSADDEKDVLTPLQSSVGLLVSNHIPGTRRSNGKTRVGQRKGSS